jgi:hypothetical protein
MKRGNSIMVEGCLRMRYFLSRPICLSSPHPQILRKTLKTKGSGTRTVCLTMVFKLMESASKKWRALNGSQLLTEAVAGVVFVDGVKKSNAA